MKPDAPAEFRGEFSPIPTNVPGLDICELMPRLATIADKYTVIGCDLPEAMKSGSLEADPFRFGRELNWYWRKRRPLRS
jgi:hypothetical protein